MKFPENDTDFEEVMIKSVEHHKDGSYSFEREDGWSFGVPKGSPVKPAAGMTARMYVKGIGYTVRGLFLDGQLVFYRTAEEDKEYRVVEQYGKDATEWVARWDEGRSIWSVSMGGIGPGYEQAIQILAVEVVRQWLSTKPEWWEGSDEEQKGKWQAARKEADAVVAKLDPQIGFSGAQVGAAVSLAGHIYRKGPRCVQEVDDRSIQVSKSFPRYDKDAA